MMNRSAANMLRRDAASAFHDDCGQCLSSEYYLTTIQPTLTRGEGQAVPRDPLKVPIEGPLDRAMDYNIKEWINKGTRVYSRHESWDGTFFGKAAQSARLSGLVPSAADIEADVEDGVDDGLCDYCQQARGEGTEWKDVVITNDLSDDLTRKATGETDVDEVSLCSRCFTEVAFSQTRILLSEFLRSNKKGGGGKGGGN